jgi:hypothetical protein
MHISAGNEEIHSAGLVATRLATSLPVALT